MIYATRSIEAEKKRTGPVDWEDVLNALDEVGYTGPYNLKLNLTRFGLPLMQETMSFGVAVAKNMLRKHYGQG